MNYSTLSQSVGIVHRSGYKYSGELIRRIFCLVAYFTKPDQGVVDPEELSRGTAFIIKYDV